MAPATLVTALLIFFGWVHSVLYFLYFGVNYSVLRLTATDLITRSVDALFVPLLLVAVVGLFVIWAGRLLDARLARSSRKARAALVWVFAALGGLLLGVGLWGVFAKAVFEFPLAVSPLSLAAGALLLVGASRLWQRASRPVRPELDDDTSTAPVVAPGGSGSGPGRRPRPWLGITELAGASLLVAICLFWAASDYAVAAGTGSAQRVESELPTYPGVMLYSAKRLGLDMPGVHETACREADGAFPFRYDGLKLITESGGQYFFLPGSWSHEDGVALVLPSSESVRLEFTAAQHPLMSC